MLIKGKRFQIRVPLLRVTYPRVHTVVASQLLAGINSVTGGGDGRCTDEKFNVVVLCNVHPSWLAGFIHPRTSNPEYSHNEHFVTVRGVVNANLPEQFQRLHFEPSCIVELSTRPPTLEIVK